MAFTFRPAVRENVGLIIGLIGGTGSGKTYTAMRLAKGIAGAARFAVIDTEAGRAKHYADEFAFDHGDLQPPFRPEHYAEAIAAADAAEYPVIVVDSTSHEWAGDGGILDWQEDELARMAGDDYQKRERVKVASWIKPKMGHKKMVQRLLQVRAHLILCFRAEPKIEMVKGAGGKMEIREKQSLTGLHGWIPVTEKNLPFELTASILLMADRPGIPHPIKLEAQHRELFPLDQAITETSGARLAAWARGGTDPAPPPPNFLQEIAAAPSAEVLRAINARVRTAKHTLTREALEVLRVASAARMKTLTHPIVAAVTPEARPAEAPAPVVTPAAEGIRWTS